MNPKVEKLLKLPLYQRLIGLGVLTLLVIGVFVWFLWLPEYDKLEGMDQEIARLEALDKVVCGHGPEPTARKEVEVAALCGRRPERRRTQAQERGRSARCNPSGGRAHLLEQPPRFARRADEPPARPCWRRRPRETRSPQRPAVAPRLGTRVATRPG